MQLMHFQRFMNENIEAARTIKTIPVLMVQGTLDKLVRPEGTWQIFSALGNNNKALIAFPSEHLIFEYGRAKPDAEAAKAAQVAANWIYEHIPQGESVPLAYTAIKSRLRVEPSQSPGEEPMAITPEAQSAAMQKAVELYSTDKFTDAMAAFQQVIAAEPGNFRARLWLSLCLEKLGEPKLALAEALKARDMAKGPDQSMRANQALLQLFEDPATHPDPLQVKAQLITAGRPTVLLFGAGWCEDSKGNAALIAQGQKYFGDKIQFKSYNVEQPAGADAARQFGVGPLPTFIFLSDDGAVRLSQFCPVKFANFAQGVGSILTHTQ